MKKAEIAGVMLIVTGIIHNSIGAVDAYDILGDILQDGLWNSTIVSGEYDFARLAIVWFMFSGFAMMLWGALLRNLDTIPPLFAWALLIICTFGAIVMPVSGFWLVIAQAVYMLWPISNPRTS